ncbi:MAG: 50S ribosomal protein L31 [Patescibacteria group bacterium]|nr:50S ribosomal protein L31 [Patescibacteria group bacterium]
MKANIHPTYYADAKVVCACGNTFTVGSTMPSIHIELCNKCHPFYTGSQKFVDTASLIQKFQDKQKKAQQFKVTVQKKKEEETRKSQGPKTLAEMLAALK